MPAVAAGRLAVVTCSALATADHTYPAQNPDTADDLSRPSPAGPPAGIPSVVVELWVPPSTTSTSPAGSGTVCVFGLAADTQSGLGE